MYNANLEMLKNRRAWASIGRETQNCPSPRSVHVVRSVLDSFRAGSQRVAEFWIPIQGKFNHIPCFAVRDKPGSHRGCLEVSQDVTHIRGLTGEQRLLDWRRK